MNNVIISGEFPEYGDALSALGYNVLYSESVDCFIPYERRHADMQCLIIDDHAFVLSRCKRLTDALSGRYTVIPCGDGIRGEYPGNVVLNAAVAGKRVIAKLRSLDEKVLEYCADNGYELINVNQGYAKCSCAIVSDDALITADKGIYNSLRETRNIEALLIGEGSVTLPGAEYGFIGGASGLDINGGKRTLYFCGNIKEHPDCDSIKTFCDKHDTEIVSLTNSALTDVGGMIFC